MTDEQLAIAMGVGLIGALVYGEFLRPLGINLIRSVIKEPLKHYLRIRQRNKELKARSAYAEGYGWAWSSVMVDGCLVSELRASLENPHPRTAYERLFDLGLAEALECIEFYKENGGL